MRYILANLSKISSFDKDGRSPCKKPLLSLQILTQNYYVLEKLVFVFGQKKQGLCDEEQTAKNINVQIRKVKACDPMEENRF